MKKLLLCTVATLTFCTTSNGYYGTLARNDPFPFFSSNYPFAFLRTDHKQEMMDHDYFDIAERISFSTSLSTQKASSATDAAGNLADIGNVNGPLNMIGMTYLTGGIFPAGSGGLYPGGAGGLLGTAATLPFDVAFPAITFNAPSYTDVTERFGFFRTGVKYLKMGARFKLDIRPCNNFTIAITGGIADLKMTLTPIPTVPSSTTNAIGFQNLTKAGTVATPSAPPEYSLPAQNSLDTALMTDFPDVFKEVGLDPSDFHSTGPEDLSIGFTLFHDFEVNSDTEQGKWARFMFTPFINLTGIIGVGKERDRSKIFSVSMGNDKHHAIQAYAGFSLDFYETMEVAVSGGCTHFFDRTIKDAPCPTHELQSVIYPFKTDIKVEPGKTWHASIMLNSYHFLSNLSAYAQYMYVYHQHDTITLVTADPAFVPSRLEDDTPFKVQLANIGLNYDLSPNFSCGAFWQAPLARRQAFKTNSILLSMVVTF